ncbi:hypothetical protein H9L39_17488 [Fusarium oxysporum f. sp. albedinis]|nr:hypothetical protein H9L39_17488 [Fusarium oxysporum f. sp. albedinis]
MFWARCATRVQRQTRSLNYPAIRPKFQRKNLSSNNITKTSFGRAGLARTAIAANVADHTHFDFHYPRFSLPFRISTELKPLPPILERAEAERTPGAIKSDSEPQHQQTETCSPSSKLPQAAGVESPHSKERNPN